jgi:hypothetical protein
MIKRLTLCFLLTCLYVPCFSQERFVVRGRILDAESAPVPYCSVGILELRDSTVLGGAVSDTEGRYSLHFEQAGRYLLCYDHLAYESCYRTVEVPEAQTLPDVILRPASRHIDEVVVVARNTEYRAGRYEVNMLGNPIVRNRSVMQVLDLLPGLRVSENTLSIKGTPVSVVYIDDRLVTDLGELSALRAEDVKSVEVQNKTGAAYSATTSGGIVRIRLKKLAAGSFYGNVSPSASVSRDGYSTGLALPFSAQCGRLGIYNYVSGFYGENETLDRTYSEFRNSGYSLDSEDRGRITSRNIRELLSLVYKINDRHSIGLGGQIFMGASDPSNTVHTTSAGLAWGDVPPQMPEAGYTLYRYGGGHALQPAVSGVAELYLPFRHVGFPALFQGRLPAPERRSELRLRHARFFPAEGCGTLLHGVAARALQAAGTSVRVPARPEQEFFGRAQLQRGVEL